MGSTRQPTFFETQPQRPREAADQIIMRALGEFQARGKVLAGRELPLDRLRGALRRAAEACGADELKDEELALTLESLGARVRRVPSFVAKHPFRITIETDLAERALRSYREAVEPASDAVC